MRSKVGENNTPANEGYLLRILTLQSKSDLELMTNLSWSLVCSFSIFSYRFLSASPESGVLTSITIETLGLTCVMSILPSKNHSLKEAYKGNLWKIPSLTSMKSFIHYKAKPEK
jgi:hypothetical protein